MKNSAAIDSGWRGSREGWLETGYRALIDSGVDAVKIQPMARQLNLSRTSFYWFFEDREDLLTALVDGWEERTTTPLISATREYAESQTEAMLNVLACFLSGEFDSRLEFAVRSWALQDRGVAQRIEAADARRISALHSMLMGWGHSELAADVRCRTIYLTQIGYISMRTVEDLEVRLARIPSYVEIYTGQPAKQRELARFNARVRQMSRPAA